MTNCVLDTGTGVLRFYSGELDADNSEVCVLVLNLSKDICEALATYGARYIQVVPAREGSGPNE